MAQASTVRFGGGGFAGAPGLDTAEDLASACRAYGEAAGWLFDSYSAGYGGSGHGFDYALLDDVKDDPVSRPLILGIVGVNVLWTVDSLLLLTTDWVAPTMQGYAFTVFQAVAVAGFAGLQYLGLKGARTMAHA